MPLKSYTLIHTEATLSDAETKEMINFITQFKNILLIKVKNRNPAVDLNCSIDGISKGMHCINLKR